MSTFGTGTRTLDEILIGDPQLDERVAAVAGGLRSRGVAPGDRVVWQRPNGWDAVVLFRACWRIGAVACPIHHLAGTADIGSSIERLRPTVVVGMDEPVPAGSAVPRGATPVSADDIAVALATSGSTGTPKIVLHSHQALVHKVAVMTGVHRLGPEDCILMPAPMSHISGLLNGVLMAASGMRVVPLAQWDPAAALRLIEAQRVTFMIGPPAYFVSLIDAPGYERRAVASLRQVSCGGAGVTPAFVREASDALGCRVKRTYGSTEAPTVTTSTLDDPPERAAETDGRPVGRVELRLAAGGELLVRGPELFVGYHDDPAATTAAFTADGWFRTGDAGVIDGEGWLTITGRLKEMIIRGGENIAVAEVEAVLEAHPAVRQAAVVAMPDRRLGERACAFVVASAPFDLEDCRRWCAAQGVTKFKWPERVEQLDALPLLPAGKPDRAALRARL